MPHLELESPTLGTLSLNGLVSDMDGVQALPGATGLGLPPVAVQWREGAGDGATFRGRRVLPRQVDIPIYVKASDRAGLTSTLSTLAKMLASEVTLRFVDDTADAVWTVKAHRVGGFTYNYGKDTEGKDDLFTVLTLEAGDPFWESIESVSTEIGGAVLGDGLLDGGSLVNLGLASSEGFGEVVIENSGDADAYPVWVAHGPCTSFTAVGPDGAAFTCNAALTTGQTITVDTRTGTVIDHAGDNRYGDMAPAPKLWKLPPGSSQVSVSMADTSSASKMTLTFRPRRWLVI